MKGSDELVDPQHFCDDLVNEGGYALAWIGVASIRQNGAVDLVCAAGATEYLYGEMASWWGSKESGLGPSGTALRSGVSQVAANLADGAPDDPWRERATQFGLGSSVSIADWLGARRAVVNVYDRRIHAFGAVKVRALEEMVRNVEFAVTYRRSLRQAEAALEKSTLAMDALKVTERNLSLSEERFRLAFEGNMAPMLFMDLDDQVTAVNDAFCRMIGRTREEILEVQLPSFTHPDDLHIVKDVNRRLASGETHQIRFVKRYLHKDGRVIVAEVSKYAARDAARTMLYTVSSTRDVTEERALTEQLVASQRLEAFGTLAGGIAHDFNSLLLVMRGYTSILLKGLQDEKMREAAERIDLVLDEATSFTTQLLASSRQQEIQPQAVDLNEIVRAGMKLMGPLLGDEVTVTLMLPDDLPLAWVDPSQTLQVLMNLITNARDAMPSNGRLSLCTEKVVLGEEYATHHLDVEPGPYLLLEIADSGVGMNEATRARMFEHFYTTKLRGTGLGLATVYGIIKQSRGHIDVTSEPGVGTTFQVYFPLAETDTEIRSSK
jgi:PAS domain S-box-containing protein